MAQRDRTAGGTPPPSTERLLRGRGRFVADLRVWGTLDMAVVRSPHAHAVLRSLDASAAAAAPGTAAVVTAADLARLAPAALQGEMPVLVAAGARARFSGQPVCAVASERGRYGAEDAAERVRAEWTALEAVTDAARDPSVPQVRSDRPSDLAFAAELGYGDAERALAASAVRAEFRVRWGRASAQPLETRGLLCVPEPLTGLTVYAAHQAPHALRRLLAAALALDEESVRVVAPDVGGGFGLKNGLYPEDVLCAVLALLTHRPVRYLEDRREHFLAAQHERDQIQTGVVGSDAEGRLTALVADVVADHGAYASRFAVVGHTARSVVNTYRLPAYRGRVRSVFTHKAPQGPYRGAGRPQANLLMERAMDRLAAALGRDPVELRRANLHQPSEYPVRIPLSGPAGPMPVVLDSGDLPALLDETCRVAGLAALRERQRRARVAGELYGIGVVCSVEDTGVGPYEGAMARLAPDGTVRFMTGDPAQGQEHDRVFGALLARTLGVDPERVVAEPTDTSRLARGIGTFASRGATSGAVAVAQVGEALADKIRRAAARVLEAAPEDMVIEGGKVGVRGAPARAIGLDELARRIGPVVPERGGAPPAEPELAATVYADASRAAFGQSVHVVALAVDREDFRVRFDRYVVGYDVGRRLDPVVVEGQILGGLSHGISGALFEELVYDGAGQLTTQSYLDYLLPTASEMPRVTLTHRETPSPVTPLGAKGVGEAGTIPAPAAVAQALEDALSPYGVVVDRLPATPDRIYGWVSAASRR
jgi:carbon-monoxide dehydrogenase large subunit